MDTFAAMAHHGFMLNSLSTTTPKAFLQSYSPAPLSPASVFAGALPSLGQGGTFAPVELHGVPVGQCLQPLWVPLDGSSAPSNISASVSHSHPTVWCHYVMSVFFTTGSTSLVKMLNGTGPRTDLCVVQHLPQDHGSLGPTI